MKVDIQVFKDSEALSLAAAEIFVEASARAIPASGRFLVALSGGGSPSGLYRRLAQEPYRKQVAWEKTFVFWGDERCVPPDDPDSNYRQAHETLLQRVLIPQENVQRIHAELEAARAAYGYTQVLKRFAAPGLDWPCFDLVLLGMGADGHTASLFPGSPVAPPAPAVPVTADYQGRPAQRVTLTPAVFNSARLVLFLVTGQDKASTLRTVLRDAANLEKYPAQRIQPADGQVVWLVDEAAGQYL